MRSIIEILPDAVINKIAAGEVIENPASVVKELIENSLDAAAQEIKVEIRGGGSHFIMVEDDGRGMGEEDIILALKRHATSKLKTLEDLYSISTMGFRGEALAAIAAISKIRIESCREGKDPSFVKVEGGEVILRGEIARRRGTTVEVCSLFYNVPVRKRFQRSQNANTAEICRVINRLSLAHPHVGFTLVSQNKRMIHWKGYQGNFKEALKVRVKELLGEEMFTNMKEVFWQDDSISIQGYIASPSLAKRNRLSQYLLINKRAVFCSSVANAVSEGYGTRIGEKMYPPFVLHLDLPAGYVDVNVHPQKKEVRLHEEMYLKQKIGNIVSTSLQSSSSWQMPDSLSFQQVKKEFFLKEHAHAPLETLPYPQEKESILRIEERLSFHPLKVCGSYYLIDAATIPSSLLSREISDGILVVDLKAAYATVLFENFRGLRKNVFPRQTLIFPVIVELSADEAVFVELFLEKFKDMGLEMRMVGDTSVAIDALPPFIRAKDFPELFSVILEDLISFERSETLDVAIVKRFAQKICRLAKGKKERYTAMEAETLLESLLKCQVYEHDPLGNATMIYWGLEDFTRFFSLSGGVR